MRMSPSQPHEARQRPPREHAPPPGRPAPIERRVPPAIPEEPCEGRRGDTAPPPPPQEGPRMEVGVLPRGARHSRTLWSSEPEAISEPSAEKATARAPPIM